MPAAIGSNPSELRLSPTPELYTSPWLLMPAVYLPSVLVMVCA